ncbi:Cof-type HAD-IIB family hydrolase [Mycoplasma sp. NEAQ87857]|uniref:Cof-type HAD-IIB family hydrolase n=1 Tax=Mycoplasma sp. NEAQ87857 TaxID=2683967 RepID=UPI001319715A|nr:Cof-type HAD-IIB family hydrolase [Mycoplasma sp. NEAQ87857]QGZ97750.1 Cof-type HAD-IIB family hydrolase [Mycoplasma sp. NEAQ87857]
MDRRLNISDKYFKLINQGSKTVEIRLNDPRRYGLKEGTLINLINDQTQDELCVKIKRVTKYNSFKDLLTNEDTSKTQLSLSDLDVLYQFYSIENEAKYGVLAIEVEKFEPSLDMIENFVFDLDGTLLNEQGKINPQNYKMLLELSKQGKNIIIATGRPLYTAKNIIKDLPTKFPIIFANGSMIYDLKQQKFIKTFPIEKEYALNIYNQMNQWGYDLLIYIPESVIGINTFKTDFFSSKNYNHRIGEQHFWENPDFNTKDYDLCKFLVIKRSNEEEKFNDVISFINKIPNVYGVVSQPPYLDVMSSKATKGNGLKYLFEQYNLDLNKTICFGDADNDESMFEICKFSGATANAFESVKSKALFQCLDHDTDWLVQFINKLNKK